MSEVYVGESGDVVFPLKKESLEGKLRRLSDVFKEAAGALTEAANALEKEQKKNQDLQRKLDKIEADKAAQTKLLQAVASGDLETVQKLISTPAVAAAKPVTVLIDGSGSMTTKLKSDAKSPLQASLDAILRLSSSGTQVSVLMWGAKELCPVEVSEDVFAKVAKGLNNGTEFKPVVEYMTKAAADKPQHFIVLSDGDMWGERAMLGNARKLLSSNPKNTLDFVVIGPRSGTAMEKFAQSLKDELPKQVRLYRGEAASLDKILMDASVPPKPAAQPAKGRQAPQYNHS